jgi:hypothetical protein
MRGVHRKANPGLVRLVDLAFIAEFAVSGFVFVGLLTATEIYIK